MTTNIQPPTPATSLFDRIIGAAVDRPVLAAVLTLAMAALGAYSFTHLPIDAVPDITNVQVQINSEAPGYSPLEVEQRITIPLETAMAGLPHLDNWRSISRYGLSQITVVFNEGTDIYFARQQIGERIQQASSALPAGVIPQLGPVATGLGEIFMWLIEADADALRPDGRSYSPSDLRELQDWVVRPQLMQVPGLAEVNSIGGYERTYVVAPDPERLAARGLALDDLQTALADNNQNVGAGYVEQNGEQILVRVPGQAAGPADLAAIVIGSHKGTPIRIADVATVEDGGELRTGAATSDGREVVIGTALMRMGENSRDVARRVADKIGEIGKNLPAGVKLTTVYDRTELVDATINTVKKNLAEGALLVTVVLFLLLGNFRAALITAAVIPLAMLFTLSGMLAGKLSANLMSLGAIDFGIIVDGAVVIVENAVRRLGLAREQLGRELTRLERRDIVKHAASEVRQAILTGQAIIMVVYLPILALTGVEGKMFSPMAMTVLLALLGAAVLSVTFVPAMIALFLSKTSHEGESRFLALLSRGYGRVLEATRLQRAPVLAAAAALVLLCGLLATRMGSEFIPSLDEGDLAVHALRVPGTSLTQAIQMQYQVETAFKTVPEVKRVFSKIGTADIATDPMPPNVADTFVILKPRAEWPDPQKPKADVVAAMSALAETLPGNKYEFTQPIQMRMNELIAGVRADVAVKVFGDDNAVLAEVGDAVRAALSQVPGAADVRVEETTGLPMLNVQIDREKLARFGVSIKAVQDVVQTAVGGSEVGQIYNGDRRFNVVVRLPEKLRSDLQTLGRLRIPVSGGGADGKKEFIQLHQVATLQLAPGPNQISRANGKRYIVASANVRGRDIGSFVADAQAAIAANVKVPPGYWLAWGGQFEQMLAAAARLKLLVPLALFLIFAFLYSAFGNVKDSLLVFTGVPLALTGGITALALRGMPLSISAGVGFIALSGVAVLNGLVMISFIQELRAKGAKLADAVRDGALLRLRPVLMTALVASLGFIPMALAVGRGAEVQRPLATVVIGGIISSTLLTLVVLPLLYAWAHVADDKATS